MVPMFELDRAAVFPAIITGFDMAADRGVITQLLTRLNQGDITSEELLMSHVYTELHRLAVLRIKHDRAGHTLQATALVHEAYLRLCRTKEIRWQDRGHFFHLAGRLMRRILTDYARKHCARKRNHGIATISLDEAAVFSSDQFATAIEIDEVLQDLGKLSPRQASVVEMRFFCGFTEAEIAEALECSERTVKRDWLLARAWLHQKLEPSSRPTGR